MAVEYSRVIYNVNRPGPKAKLVSIPMYMYRIKTNKFKYGLDYFQKAVLMFKSKPGVENATIAACLGLDEDLINEVQGELEFLHYLTPDGLMTQTGVEMKNNLDTIIVDKDSQEIGYIFQYVDRNDYYPYYIKKLGDSPNLTNNNEIVIGTKGDGIEKTKMPYFLNFIFSQKRNLPTPSERTIFDIISKSGKQGINSEKLSVAELGRNLSLSFLQDSPGPTLVNVCTYIYLPQREDGLYETEWQVLDPFGFGNNSQLKFYLESFKDDAFKKELSKSFDGAETFTHKSFGVITNLLETEVSKLKEEDFDVMFDALDRNLQQYLKSVVKNIFILRERHYDDMDSSDNFIISCQRALETIFLLDKEKRSEYYEQMYSDYCTPAGGDRARFGRNRKNVLTEMIRNGIISMSNPGMLISIAKNVEPNRANSLKHYICAFLLTYCFDNSSPLFRLIEGKLDQVFNIAVMRNEKGHGQTESEGLVTSLDEQTAENCYNFMKDFVNNYMNVVL